MTHFMEIARVASPGSDGTFLSRHGDLLAGQASARAAVSGKTTFFEGRG